MRVRLLVFSERLAITNHSGESPMIRSTGPDACTPTTVIIPPLFFIICDSVSYNPSIFNLPWKKGKILAKIQHFS
jgi:hypothetical protein